MSWGFECANCDNKDNQLFKYENARYEPVKRLTCLVCRKDLKHLDYGMTEVILDKNEDDD